MMKKFEEQELLNSDIFIEEVMNKFPKSNLELFKNKNGYNNEGRERAYTYNTREKTPSYHSNNYNFNYDYKNFNRDDDEYNSLRKY